MPRKCYLGCRGPKTKLTIHSFPNPRTHLDQLKAWVEVVGGKLETDADYLKFRKSSICDAHFTLKDRNRFNHLNALAVPSLYLDGDLSKAPPSLFSPPPSSPPPAPPPAPSEKDPLAETEVTGAGDLSKAPPALFSSPPPSPPRAPPPAPAETAEDPLADTEVTGTVITKDITEDIYDTSAQKSLKKLNTSVKVYIETFQPTHDQTQPDCTSQDVADAPPRIDSRLTKPEPTKTDCFPVLPFCRICQARAEHNYDRDVLKEEKTKDNKLAASSEHPDTELSRLSMQVKQLQTQNKSSKTQIYKLKKHNRLLKDKMAEMRKNHSTDIVNKVTSHMTPAGRILMRMQFTQTKKAAPGRRFTPEEKALAISMFNSSPSGYLVLSKFLTLPSKKHIKKHFLNLQQKIKLETEVMNEDLYKSEDTENEDQISESEDQMYESEGIENKDQIYESEVIENEDQIYECEVNKNEDKIYESEVMENEDQIYESEVIENEDQIYVCEVNKNEDKIYESEVMENEDQIYESEGMENEDQIYESEGMENEDQIYESEGMENEDQIYESEVIENEETMCIDNVVNEITLRNDSSGQTCVVENSYRRTHRVELSESYNMPEI